MQKEWIMLKHVMEFMKLFLNKSAQVYPLLCSLVAIGLTIPVTSVSCERYISAYNAIKTDSRNALRVTSVNILMHLYLESKSLEQFDFNTAFQHWITAKDRRSFKTLLKK